MFIEMIDLPPTPDNHEVYDLDSVIELIQRESGPIYVTQSEEGGHIAGCWRIRGINDRRFESIAVLPETV